MTAASFHSPLRFASNQTGDYRSIYQPRLSYGTVPHYNPTSRRFADRHLLAVIDHFAKPGEAVLELGCNRGNNLLTVAEKGYLAYGLDIDPRFVADLTRRIAKRGSSIEAQVKQWDFAEKGDTPWPQMKGKFKAIYATHVLSHLSGPHLIKTMQAMKEQLAPGGVIVATIIEKNWLRTLQDPYYLLNRAVVRILRPLVLNTNLGMVQHSDATLAKAFEGLEPVKAFSRYFKPGEMGHWPLPQKNVKWVVYQKPL